MGLLRRWFKGEATLPDKAIDNLAWAAGLPASIDDVALEAFQRLLRIPDKVCLHDPYERLLRIVLNVVAEWRERTSAKSQSDKAWMDEFALADADDANARAQQPRELEHWQEVLDRLPQREREIVLMHVNEGMPHQRIAAGRGLSVTTVIDNLKRAYTGLRMHLGLLKYESMRDEDRSGTSTALKRAMCSDAAEWFVILRDGRNVDAHRRLRFVRWIKASPLHIAELWRIRILCQRLRAVKIEYRPPPPNSTLYNVILLPRD